MGDLAVAGEDAVDPQVEAGVHALEVQELTQGQILCGPFKMPHIEPAGVFIRHIGRVTGEGVIHIGILVSSVSVVLPAGGHRDHIHLLFIEAEEVFASSAHGVQKRIVIPEGPVSVQGKYPGRGSFKSFGGVPAGEVVAPFRSTSHVEN